MRDARRHMTPPHRYALYHPPKIASPRHKAIEARYGRILKYDIVFRCYGGPGGFHPHDTYLVWVSLVLLPL